MANGFHSVSYADYDGERSSFGIHTDTLTETNFATQETALGTLRTTALVLTKGVMVQHEAGNRERVALGPATDPEAQRELKWAVHYHDVTTFNRYVVELPCADPSFLDAAKRSEADLTDPSVAAFVAAFEAVAVAPVSGNAIVVDRLVLVGRNI